MAVVAQLSVNLSAQTAAYSKGLDKAKKDTVAFERQVSRTQRVLSGFRASMGRVGARLSPLGIGPGGLTGIGAGFMAARFTRQSLQGFSETKQGAELKGTMEGLNQSVKDLQVSFGGWLATTLDMTGGLKTLKAGIDAINPSTGAAVFGAVEKRTQSVVDDPVATAARKSLKENLKQQGEIQKQIAEAAARMGSGGMFRSMTRLISDPIDASQIKLLEQQLGTLRAEQSALLPQAGLQSLAGGGFGQRSGGATLPEEHNRFAHLLFDNLPKLIDQGIKGFEDFSASAVGQLDKIDSAFQQMESDAQDFMAAFKISEGQLSPLETFKRDTEELQRLFDRGFLKDDAFDLALLDARRKLEQFAGLDTPLPGRVGGARRGSVEAFEKVAAFQDGKNNPVQRTLDELLVVTKEQLRVQKDAAKRNREQFDDLDTIDTKP